MSDANTPLAPSFAALVQQLFTDYLLAQRAMSPNTVASYRDAMLLFLDFAHERLGKMPTELRLADLEPDLILAFLEDLERRRNNSVRSRNLRLTALRAFLKFAGRHDLASLSSVEQALGVPMKRFERPMLGVSFARGDARGHWPAGRELDFAARSPVADDALQHGGARLGNRRRTGRRCCTRCICLCASARQRPKTARGTLVEIHDPGSPRLAAMQSSARGGCAVATQPRRPRDDTPKRQPTIRYRRDPCRPNVSLPRETACLAAYGPS